jgi:hypothetical protein
MCRSAGALLRASREPGRQSIRSRCDCRSYGGQDEASTESVATTTTRACQVFS